MQFPLPEFVAVSAQNPWTYVVFGLIGFAFGFTLEMSGFGDSRKLAAQFYFTELTVLKVMFTAIVTAMVLLFGAVSLGLLDFNLVWVNPTYLASGILGGVIMGVGFIVGGFCPTTSLASASTGKIDGMLFMFGGFFGAFLFGETEKYFDQWYSTAGYYGRVTLDQVLGLPIGVVVLLVVFMALFMFWGAEQLERIFGKKDLTKEPKIRLAGAGLLAAAAFAVVFIGTPTTAEKWAGISEVKEEALASRSVQIHPGELLATMADDRLQAVILDVRPESDYNLFHIQGAVNVPLEEVPAYVPTLLEQQALNKVYVVVSNDEAAATEAWKTLAAESVPNAYILEGGINNWIATFGETDPQIRPIASPGDDLLAYLFPAALGDRYECASPSPLREWDIEFTPKIKLELKRDKSGGGCG
ncbi:MAG: rhodanese-like domain-containing protein [Chloroflexota bacterium]